MSGPPAPIVVSIGEPAGVGPEIVAKAWLELRGRGPAFVAVGDKASLEAVTGVRAPVRAVSSCAEGANAFGDALPVLDIPLAAPVAPGRPTPAAAARVIAWIETAVRLAMSGEAAAVVTAPIAKAVLYEAGFPFPGHTEFLGHMAPAAPGPVMMLVARDLRCALVTIHEPIARLPTLLTTQAVFESGLTTAEALMRDFGIPRPRLAVTGLNPHAGEGGALGGEEAEVIMPAIQALKEAGVDATGPHPADSLFHAEARSRYDAALCMYHDQALIPVKMLDFWAGVNVTLGLSIIRTSPDHGVAFDIAGRDLARPDSLIAAIRLARSIADRRQA